MGLFDFLKRASKKADTATTTAAAQSAAAQSAVAQSAAATAGSTGAGEAAASETAAAETAVGSLLGEGGAKLPNLLGRLSAGGLDDVVKSWIGMGENKGVGADQIKAVFSSEEIWVVAGKMGVTEEVAADKIAKILPGIVDKLTPDGLITDPDSVADKLDGLLKGKLG